jgi:hypothetical protein
MPPSVLGDWQALTKWLAGVSPEYRARVVSLCIELDLEAGRVAYRDAMAAGERFKADLIKRNGPAVVASAKVLSASVGRAMDALTTWRAVGLAAVRATEQARQDLEVFRWVRASFVRVARTWSDVSAAKGEGMTRDDTPAGVAKARREFEDEQRRKRGAGAKDDDVLVSTAPVKDAYIAEETANQAKRDRADAEDRAKATTKSTPKGGLFGG